MPLKEKIASALERASSVATFDKNSNLFEAADDESLEGLIIKEVTKPQLTGNLWKRPDKGLITAWKFRKFALDNNEDRLYYFAPENPTKAKGFIELRKAYPTVKELPEVDPLAFAIDVPGRCYILKAESDKDKQMWLTGLKELFPLIVRECTEREVFGQVSKSATGKQIVGGTTRKLALKLTDATEEDADFEQVYLLTFTSFTTKQQLMDFISARFKYASSVKPPEKGKQMHLKMLHFLNGWVSQGFDFVADKQLHEQLESLLKQAVKLHLEGAEALQKLLERKTLENKHSNYEKIAELGPIYELERKLFGQSLAKPTITKQQIEKIPIEKYLSEIEALEFARQLTLMEFQMFHSIQPKECFGQCWTKKDKQTKAPNIVALTTHFNHVSHLVSTDILQKSDPKQRANSISKWIDVARRCRELNNFNAISEILSGFENSAINRLKHTWCLLSQSQQKTLESLKELVSYQHSFRNLRTTLHASPRPCLPYLGVYLTDLVFIEEGNKDNLEEGVINFGKRRKIAHVIRVIQQYQQSPYFLETLMPIQNFIRNYTVISDEDQLYKLSLTAEPRDSSPVADA